jgi:hypothetical protein
LTDDLDEIYRRASALDRSRPSEAVRRRVLEHAAALAAAPRPAANRARWRPAIFGTLAAAGLAGLLVIPRVFNPHAPAESADTAAPAKVPPVIEAQPPAGAPPFADALSTNSAPAPFPPPQAAARSRAVPPAQKQTTASREDVQAAPPTAEASRLAASRLKAADQREAAQSDAVAQPDAAARSGAAAHPDSIAHPGLMGGYLAAPAHPASPPADPSSALWRAAETGDVQRLRAILGADVRIDPPDARGRTALMLAVARGHAESVDVLLAHGADPNAVDADGVTPLKAALAADQPAIVAALRRAGAR